MITFASLFLPGANIIGVIYTIIALSLAHSDSSFLLRDRIAVVHDGTVFRTPGKVPGKHAPTYIVWSSSTMIIGTIIEIITNSGATLPKINRAAPVFKACWFSAR